MAQIWLVTVPNNKDSNGTTLNSIQKLLTTYNLKVYEIEIPNLVVGTLDTLIALGDELNKISAQTENVVKKVERQYSEICGSEIEPLRINETSIEGYLKKFQWDYAHYQHQGRQLKEIVNQIQSMSNKIDEDLKLLVNTYTEKTLSLGAIKRKKIINLVTSDIEDFLEPKHITSIDAINTDYFITVLVTVPKSLETDFLETYNTIGSNIASYGGPDYNTAKSYSFDELNINHSTTTTSTDRSDIKGSPVVPNSAKKILESDDYVLYVISILKGQYQAGCILDDIFVHGKYIDYIEPLKVAFKEKKFVIRDLIYNETNLCGTDQLIKQGEQELNQIKSTFIRWCKAHFSSAYNGWLHLKMIQAFVESVLKYGLPINFTSLFFEPNKNEKDSLLKLTSTINTIRPELLEKSMHISNHEDVDEDDEDSNDTDNLPYVCLKLSIIGSNSNNNN